jgi:glycosyltransferase involved in cell wall biosynthesis
MNCNKLISIIVPTKNASSTILYTLESIKKQSYSNFECIIVLNGCNDNTEEVCKRINDNRFKIYKYNESGVWFARNEGISIAKGEYIIFIDADDYVDSNYIENLMKWSKYADIIKSTLAIHNNNYNNASCYWEYKNHWVIKLDDNIAFNSSGNDFGHNSGVLYKTEIIKNIKQKPLNNFEDLIFNIEVLFKYKQIFVVPFCGYHYCRFNSKASKNKINFNDLLKCYDELEVQYNTKYPEIRDFIIRLINRKSRK